MIRPPIGLSLHTARFWDRFPDIERDPFIDPEGASMSLSQIAYSSRTDHSSTRTDLSIPGKVEKSGFETPVHDGLVRFERGDS